jgi:hypothetical protein
MANARVRLDYAAAANKKLLENVSGVAVDGEFLWSVSDERRTFECLRAEGDGFVLSKQHRIDTLIKWPGADEGQHGAELDLESIDVAGGALWLCGSHCNVRRKPAQDQEGKLLPEIDARPSRRLLARIEVNGDELGKIVKTTPFEGPGSIRCAVAGDPWLHPFIDLPSKENGLDIEGMAVFGDEVLLGLRGPRLDSFAVVVHLTLADDLKVGSYRLSFLDLGGLAIRDLGRDGDTMMIVAGPVGDAGGPFGIFRWKPKSSPLIQAPDNITPAKWPASSEKPEGICVLQRNDKKGYLVVYDSPNPVRIQGNAYEADWLVL